MGKTSTTKFKLKKFTNDCHAHCLSLLLLLSSYTEYSIFIPSLFTHISHHPHLLLCCYNSVYPIIERILYSTYSTVQHTSAPIPTPHTTYHYHPERNIIIILSSTQKTGSTVCSTDNHHQDPIPIQSCRIISSSFRSA